MRPVPGQQEVHVLTGILEFYGEVDGDGESCIAVACSMTDIPVWSNRCLSVADETHGVHQPHVLADGIANCGVVLLSCIIGERKITVPLHSVKNRLRRCPGMQPPLCIVLNRTNGITYQKHIFLMCSAEVTDFCYLCATMVQIQPYHQTYVLNGIPHIRPDWLLR